MIEEWPKGDRRPAWAGSVVVGVRQNVAGTWTVEDVAASRGGLFLTWNAALRYIRRDFGPDARIVMQTPSMREAA